MVNPYDELPYRARPIEWSAPEHLAIASLLHGGPRPSLEGYRVLELGCANGANLLPLAYYRRHGTFVGIDGARSQISVARQRAADLELDNVTFTCADLTDAESRLDGEFDFIIAHGVFSWVPPDVRDALLKSCARHLAPDGLLYLNYNSKPGWIVRGMVRDFLLAQTAGVEGLRARAEAAQAVSSKLVGPLDEGEHPYSRLMANEFRFVCEKHFTYVAHEYLAAHNHAYWHGEFVELVAAHGLSLVADADFNYPWVESNDDMISWLLGEQIIGRSISDTVDLLLYRQLRSPILTRSTWARRAMSVEEFSRLRVAAQLAPVAGDDLHPKFVHPNGYEVDVTDDEVCEALLDLLATWPCGQRIAELFADVSAVEDDILLLYRNGMVELRCIEPADCGVSGEGLNQLEAEWGGYQTTPYHTRDAAPGAHCQLGEHQST